MEAITASLERDLQNCSLNGRRRSWREEEDESSTTADSAVVTRDRGGSISSSSENNHINPAATLELNSHISLPYHWEQCLDLKTGEIYYINWSNGMKAKEDPRVALVEEKNCQDSSDSEDDEDEEQSWYDSEEEEEESSSESSSNDHKKKENDVLVVAGCKICLMYLMVPKHVQDCPKCFAQLLHFDRSLNSSP